MPLFQSGDVLGIVLLGILLASAVGVIGFVLAKLGAPPRTLMHRGLKIRLNAGLPPGKIVLVDAAWRPIGETDPGQFETLELLEGCAAAWLSTRDFGLLEARKTSPSRPLSRQPLRSDLGLGR